MAKEKSKKFITKIKELFKTFINKCKSFFIWLKEKIIPPRKKPKKKIDKRKITGQILLAITIIFMLSITTITINVNKLISAKNSVKRNNIGEPIKHIEIKDGYITEKLIVESGEILPNIKEYFSPNYDIDEKYQISYYLGNIAIPIETFTVKNEDNLLHVIGANNNLTVLIQNYSEEYESNLYIKDTTPPTVKTMKVTIDQGDEVNPRDFIALYNDNSHSEEYIAEITNEDDFSEPGEYQINLKVCDYQENCVYKNSTLYIRENPNGDSPSTKPKPSGNVSKPNSESSNNNNPKPRPPRPKPNPNPNPKPNPNPNPKPNPPKPKPKPKPSSTLPTAPSRKVIGRYNKSNYDLVTNHYGTTESTKYNNVEYILYDDGYVEIVNKGNAISGTTWNYNGFEINRNNQMLMKRDAINTFLTSKDFYNKLDETFLLYTNEERRKRGAQNVTIDYDLNIIAQMRCYEIVYGNLKSHDRPNGQSLVHLIKDEYGYTPGSNSAGRQFMGENLAWGYQTNADAIKGLIASPGHYNLMTDKSYTKMGVGRLFNKRTKENIWIQIFSS